MNNLNVIAMNSVPIPVFLFYIMLQLVRIARALENITADRLARPLGTEDRG
jgi:hypothetical protein